MHKKNYVLLFTLRITLRLSEDVSWENLSVFAVLNQKNKKQRYLTSKVFQIRIFDNNTILQKYLKIDSKNRLIFRESNLLLLLLGRIRYNLK